MLISVHLPKTAGTSFIRSLETHFGSKLVKDYGDLPVNTPPYERNQAALLASVDNACSNFAGIECMHGHFLPLKYLLLSLKIDLKFITWLRDPVERILSHFHFWKRYYDPATAPRLHRKVVEEDWSLEKFCLAPELQNVYAQFLWGFPLEYFEFIGITEYYADDLLYFSRQYLNTELKAYTENVGDNKAGKYTLDKNLRTQILRFHAYDVELYNRALAMRQARVMQGICK